MIRAAALLPLCRLAACAALVIAGAAMLVRLVIWLTGTAQMSEALLAPPQIFEWHAEDPAFGGLSALLMAPDGRALVTGSDRGVLVEAPVTRDASGRITYIPAPIVTTLRMQRDRPMTRFRSDLEALTRAGDGTWMTSFEGYTRIERLRASGSLPTATHRWDRFTHLFGNQGFEALATLPEGGFLAIQEDPDDPGPAPSVLYDGARWVEGPAIPVTPGYAITGADVGPDGCLYLVERRFTLASGFSFRLMRLSGGPGTWQRSLLYAAAPATLGNAEAISAWADRDALVLSVLSDNNFLPFTPTRLMEFRVKPGVACVLEI